MSPRPRACATVWRRFLALGKLTPTTNAPHHTTPPLSAPRHTVMQCFPRDRFPPFSCASTEREKLFSVLFSVVSPLSAYLPPPPPRACDALSRKSSGAIRIGRCSSWRGRRRTTQTTLRSGFASVCVLTVVCVSVFFI